MEFLIPDVQNIIYKYVHEMNMFDILYEMTCFLDDHCERLCFELEKNILLGLYDCVNTSYCINTPALSSNQKKLKDLIKSEKFRPGNRRISGFLIEINPHHIPYHPRI